MTTKTSAAKPFATKGKDAPAMVFSLLVLLPALSALFIVHAQRLPFPYQDDFKALLGFTVRYLQASGIAAKAFQIATFPYGDYRLIFDNLLVAVSLEVTHHVNFAALNNVAPLFVLGIFALLWYSFRQQFGKATSLLYFLPVSLLWFSLTYWETLNWAEASLQNVPVVFFALATLLLIAPRPMEGTHELAEASNLRFLLGFLAAFLCACCSPNGFLLGPVGLLLLISRRSYIRASLWCLAFVLPLCAYLYHRRPSPPVHLQIRQPVFFIEFFGCAFPWRPIAFVVGAALLTIVVRAVRSGSVKQNPALTWFCLWIFLTGGLVEAIRVSINSRYSIYSSMLMICCYFFLFQGVRSNPAEVGRQGLARFTRGHFLQVAIACSFLFYVQASYRAYTQLHARRLMVIGGLQHYLQNPQTNTPQANPAVDRDFPDESPFELNMLHTAAEQGFYTVPTGSELMPYAESQ